MTVNLSIKGVPEEWAQRLRQRALRNHRSLQGELLAIVEQAAREEPAPSPAAPAALQRTLEQIEEDRRQRGWRAPYRPGLPLAVDIVRADRDRR